MTSLKNVWIAMIVVAIIAVIGVFTPSGKSVIKSFGGVTNYDETDVSAVKVGSNGSRFSLIATGTCTLTSDTSITATTTGSGTCATTNSLAGDVVVVGPLATTTTKATAQFLITAAVATTNSTTVTLLNLTGASAVPGSLNGFGSSTPYQIYRTTSTIPGL